MLLETQTTASQTSFSDVFKSSFLKEISSISITDAVLAIGISLLIGLFIYIVYKKTFSGVVYSHSFNVSLFAITLITTVLILGVTSNVVLSLGMVGALSIVRFRTSIKDPIDIVFLFWSISMGILSGAGLLTLAVVGTPLIGVLLIVFANKTRHTDPYLLIIKLEDSKAEKGIVQSIERQFDGRLKSKTVMGGESTEIVYEIRLKDLNTSFVTKFSNTPGVISAVLVSYDGNYTA